MLLLVKKKKEHLIPFLLMMIITFCLMYNERKNRRVKIIFSETFKSVHHLTFMNNNPNVQINIFRSLFQGREDVFAVRWEKSGKSGYMPAYFYDPYHYRVHKLNGGSFKDYADKTYLTLTDDQIEKHLTVQQLIGLYPLLTDNTSWFIVADFDEKDWIDATDITSLQDD